MPTFISRLYDRHLRPQHGQDSFPTQQLFVLALCRICEPIAFMSIFPYAYRMIETFNLTQDETKISIYAGALITAFAFAEFSTGMIWGRISDRVGRKPVLIMGLVGTALSMICFGFATNLWTAILARALGGLLNGNVGVLQTTVAELVTKKEHQPRAYSIMPFVWCLGSIIGPAMGGALAMPCDAYPWLFSKGSIFDKYPFLLPNLVCVIILLFGITNGILFLEETHSDKKERRDRGREIGRTITKRFLGIQSQKRITDKFLQAGEDADEFNNEDPPPGYQSTQNSPRMNTSPAPVVESDLEASLTEKVNRGVSKTFNKQVVLIIVGYGILAYHSVSFDSLMPTFLSEERMQSVPQLPFKFMGGFALSTKTIGFMMAVQGVYSMIAQLWLFPFIVRRIGTLTAFRSLMVVWPLLYFAVPYLVLLPENLQKVGIYFCLLCKITFHVIAFPSIAILLANAAHSKSVLGTINGAAASTACLARAFGPTVTGSVHAAGLKLGYNGPAWWVSGLVCAIGAFEAFMIDDTEARAASDQHEDEDTPVCEPLLLSTTMESCEETEVTRRDSLSLIEGLNLNDTKS